MFSMFKPNFLLILKFKMLENYLYHLFKWWGHFFTNWEWWCEVYLPRKIWFLLLSSNWSNWNRWISYKFCMIYSHITHMHNSSCSPSLSLTSVSDRQLSELLFLLPLPYYRKVMEVLFSVKIFDVEFSPDIHVLRSPESKKVVFGNWSVRMYVCVCVCDSKVDI